MRSPDVHSILVPLGLVVRHPDHGNLTSRELADRAVELRQVNVLIGSQPDAMDVETTRMRLVGAELRQLLSVRGPNRQPVGACHINCLPPEGEITGHVENRTIPVL
jgi:hypothetical protein